MRLFRPRSRLSVWRWLHPAPVGFFLLAAALVLAAVSARAQTAPVPPVNTRDRAQVCDFYRDYYLSSNHVSPGWTGSVASGLPGAVNPAYLRATLRRINYFRAMSGLPGNVVFDAAYNARCQQAALMMAAAGVVTHAPPSSWKFYTRLAAQTAAHSNLNLNWRGDEGPNAIDCYMDDPGEHNACVGHRRWILCPITRIMGTGVVPAEGASHPGTNVTWITDGAPRLIPVSDDLPVTSEAPVAPATSWPPPGFVPAPLVFNRWSFALTNADFRHAAVQVVKAGRALPVVLARLAFQSAADGSGAYLGANTLVWTLPGNPVARGHDETYRVQVTGVRIAGQPHDFTYTVTSIDPSRRDRLDAPSAQHGERLAVNAVGVR